MRWISIALLLFFAQPLLAQSLGDVARAQREEPNHPKAKRVITNADIDSPAAPLPDQAQQPGAKPVAKPAATRPQAVDSERVLMQQHLNELNQRVQVLQGELTTLENERISLRNSTVYGDPKRVQHNDEFNRLVEQIDAKNKELSAARNELSEALERANKTTVWR